MFVPAMVLVSLVATVLFGLVGFDALVDPLPLDRVVLVRHALLGAGACLLHVLSQSWFALYLVGTGRALARASRGAPQAVKEPLAEATAARRRLLPWCLVVPLSALVAFLLGGATFAGMVGGRSHGLAFGVSLLVQGCALWAECRGLFRHERAFARADRELAALGLERGA